MNGTVHGGLAAAIFDEPEQSTGVIYTPDQVARMQQTIVLYKPSLCRTYGEEGQCVRRACELSEWSQWSDCQAESCFIEDQDGVQQQIQATASCVHNSCTVYYFKKGNLIRVTL